MDRLIGDSSSILHDSKDALEFVYSWMDVGSNLCDKLRVGNLLTEQEKVLCNNLTNLIKKVKLTDDIVLYRGIKGVLDLSIVERQFNVLTPDQRQNSMEIM